MTGQYDRQGQAAKLTSDNEARIAADPFSGVPGTENSAVTMIRGTETGDRLGIYDDAAKRVTDIQGRTAEAGDLGAALDVMRRWFWVVGPADEVPADEAPALFCVTDPATGVVRHHMPSDQATDEGLDAERTCCPEHDDPAPATTEAPTPGTDTMLARDVKRGWHMAGVGTIEKITRVSDRELGFTGPEGDRVFNSYTLVEVTRPAPVMWNAEWPYPEFTAAEFAAHYLLAGEIIAARGYNAGEMRGYDGTPGVSIVTALKIAARERAQAADPQADMRQWEITAANVAEELETRLSAVIYTLGLLHSRTGIRDFSDQLAAWELGHYTTGPGPVRSDALSLLATAAGIFTHISDTQAEVTAPPVPEAGRLDGCTCAAIAGSHKPSCQWAAQAPRF
jgi:hypothetical protein